MPILKAIAGHGGTAGIRRYLERGNRALARDVMNLPMEEWVGEVKAFCVKRNLKYSFTRQV